MGYPPPIVIYNPLAGRNRRDRDGAVKAALMALGPLYEAVTPADLGSCLERIWRRSSSRSSGGRTPAHIVVSGGDGTVQSLLTLLFTRWPGENLPMLTILPGGTTNLIAADVGPRGSQRDSLKRLSQTRPCMITRHVLRFRQEGVEGSLRYGMFLGAEAIGSAVAYYQRILHDGSLWGPPGIALTMIVYAWKALLKRPRKGLEDESTTSGFLEVNGRLIVGNRPFLAMASSLFSLFGFLRPYRIGLADQPLCWFTTCGSCMANPSRVIKALVSGLPPMKGGDKPWRGLGRDGNRYDVLRQCQAEDQTSMEIAKGLSSWHFAKVRFSSSVPVALDGELFFPTGVEEEAWPCSNPSDGIETESTEVERIGWYEVMCGGKISFLTW